MSDPLSEIVRLLQPQAAFAKVISGKGDWTVRYPAFSQPGFCIMLEGSCRLSVDGHAPIILNAGDFVLLPTTPGFTLSSLVPAAPIVLDPGQAAQNRQELRYGESDGPPDMRSLGGSFLFNCHNPGLLVSMLPQVVHVPGSSHLSQLVRMVREETTDEKPGSAFMLSRLAELLLVEALRWSTAGNAPPGLLRGMGDARLAAALTQMHADIGQRWSVARLAGISALSRSAFCERFARAVGLPPMEYLLSWRMEIAKTLLTQEGQCIADIAERIGYGSTSAFSVAFSRHVGMSPTHYAKAT